MVKILQEWESNSLIISLFFSRSKYYTQGLESPWTSCANNDVYIDYVDGNGCYIYVYRIFLLFLCTFTLLRRYIWYSRTALGKGGKGERGEGGHGA